MAALEEKTQEFVGRGPIKRNETADEFFRKLYMEALKKADSEVLEKLTKYKRYAEVQGEDSWPGSLVQYFSDLVELCKRNGRKEIAEEFFEGILKYYGGRGFVEKDVNEVIKKYNLNVRR